jgi:hypothetical protein
LTLNLAPNRAFNDDIQGAALHTGGIVVHVERDHGENRPGVEDIDARVRDAMMPPILDIPVP